MTERTLEMARLPEPGEVIAGKYVVAELLGRGAMGVVVAATHRDLDQRVAIKFMTAHGEREQARARFVREARAVASLESEHIVRLLDFGTLEDGAPYMVMQHLSGRDLLRELKSLGGKLAQQEAVDFVLQVCVGLAEAHAQGIVHRDIKPSNLFVTRRANGEPLLKILDFGISKADDASPGELSLTDSSSLLGSPLYMSPEQVRQAKSVDQRTDIWSLGVVLYHLLAGKSPFEGVGASAVVAAIVADDPIPLEQQRPDIAPGLARVVARCLQKAPAYRYQSVVELGRELAPLGSRRAKLWLAQLEARAESGPVSSSPLVAATFDDRAPAAGQDTAAPSVVERPAAASRGAPRYNGRVIVAVASVVAFAALLTVLTKPWRSASSEAAAASAAHSAEPRTSAAVPTSSVLPTPPVPPSAAEPAPSLARPIRGVRPPAVPERRTPAKPVTSAAPRRPPDPLDDHT